MKKVFIGVAAVVILVAGALIFLLGSLDSIVQKAIEEVGTQTTKTEVKAAGVSISLSDAQGSLTGLTVANPSGFSGNKAIALGEIKIKLDAKTLTSDTIVIKEIMINKPSVNYELGQGGSNFDVIKNNVAGAGKSSSSEPAKSDGPKMVIENLYINDGNVMVTSALTAGKPISASLPKIHLKDIGKKSGGATADEVAKLVLSSITKNIGSTVGKLDLSQLQGVADVLKNKGLPTNGVKQGLDGTGDKLKGLFR